MARMTDYLDYAGISARTGIKPAVLHKYQSEARRRREQGTPRLGDMPPPDKTYAGRPVWRPETIDAWLQHRPGRGAGGGPKPRRTT